jgi:hypothetical protein
MDIGAELTLQIARFAQDRFSAPRSAARWHLLPGGDAYTWAEAGAALTALPKPLLVAPLNEPGLLGIWMPAMLDGKTRAWFDHHLANQSQYWQEKLRVCGVSETDRVVFAPATPALALTAPEFLHWASEYVLGVPITMDGKAEGRDARLLIMPPGGGGPPLGARDPYDAA